MLICCLIVINVFNINGVLLNIFVEIVFSGFFFRNRSFKITGDLF